MPVQVVQSKTNFRRRRRRAAKPSLDCRQLGQPLMIEGMRPGRSGLCAIRGLSIQKSPGATLSKPKPGRACRRSETTHLRMGLRTGSQASLRPSARETHRFVTAGRARGPANVSARTRHAAVTFLSTPGYARALLPLSRGDKRAPPTNTEKKQGERGSLLSKCTAEAFPLRLTTNMVRRPALARSALAGASNRSCQLAGFPPHGSCPGS